MAAQEEVAILGVFVADLAFRAGRQPKDGETIVGSGFKMGPGGKGSNQSVAAARAILSVMPLDSFVEHATYRMEVVGNPKDIQPVQKEVQAEIDQAEGKPWPMGSIERMAFYEHAKKAYCVITTAETRFYGCFIFTKGVIPPKE